MPRKHRAARDRAARLEAVELPLGVAPAWAQIEGATVRAVSGEKGKTYRCPGCLQEIRAGTPHLVVVEQDDLEGRRHWHTGCWRRELRRRGYSV
ncbi:MAG TPA: hypothetical protein VGL18_16675 [Actinomycetota bacterium]